jgi:DASH complex subunit SPC19
LEGKGSLRKQSLERLVRRVGTPNGTGEGREAEERKSRLKALREKKERLGYAVERLTLQS